MLQQAAYEVFQKCTDALPCNNLGLTATEFQVRRLICLGIWQQKALLINSRH